MRKKFEKVESRLQPQQLRALDALDAQLRKVKVKFVDSTDITYEWMDTTSSIEVGIAYNWDQYYSQQGSSTTYLRPGIVKLFVPKLKQCLGNENYQKLLGTSEVSDGWLKSYSSNEAQQPLERITFCIARDALTEEISFPTCVLV